MDNKSYAYPAYFYYDDDGISIEFPNLPGCLPCAKDTETAFVNAREALGLHLYGMEKDNDEIPQPSSVKSLSVPSGAIVTMVEVFMPAVRDRINNRFVKKTLSVPAWLNSEAEKAHVNFSQVLQDGLKNYLGM